MTTETRQPAGDSGPEVAGAVASRVLDVPDFPQPGIVFKDLTPLFADGPGGWCERQPAVAAHAPVPAQPVGLARDDGVLGPQLRDVGTE